MHLDLCVMLEALDQLINAAHLVDTLSVLEGGFLNLEVDFCSGQIFLVLFNKTLLLSLDGLLLADSKVVGGLALDLSYALITMSLDELDHAVKNLSGSLHFLLNY